MNVMQWLELAGWHANVSTKILLHYITKTTFDPQPSLSQIKQQKDNKNKSLKYILRICFKKPLAVSQLLQI